MSPSAGPELDKLAENEEDLLSIFRPTFAQAQNRTYFETSPRFPIEDGLAVTGNRSRVARSRDL